MIKVGNIPRLILKLYKDRVFVRLTQVYKVSTFPRITHQAQWETEEGWGRRKREENSYCQALGSAFNYRL